MSHEVIYMDAVLSPNRSQTRGLLLWVVGGLGLVSFLSGLLFLSIGAWPVFGFFGLDMLVLGWLLRRHMIDQRQQTRVRVTADTLSLCHRDGRGRERRADVPSAFARVELDAPGDQRSHLRIEYGATAWVIGRFLTAEERKSLAEALRSALLRSRRERHPG